MQEAALKHGPWHPPTKAQKPVHVGEYDSTTWDPHRKDGFMPSPIRTYWDGKQWLWEKGGLPCKFQERSWRGSTQVNEKAQLNNETTIIASKGGVIELVEVVERFADSLHFRRIGSGTTSVLRKKGVQYHKEFKTTEAAIAWIESCQKAKKK